MNFPSLNEDIPYLKMGSLSKITNRITNSTDLDDMVLYD